MCRSENERYHAPFLLDLLLAKLLGIPSSSTTGGDAKVDCDKDHTGQKSSVTYLAFWCRDNSHGKIQEAFTGIMWAYQMPKESLLRKRVLFQARQMLMTSVLHDPCGEEENYASELAQGWLAQVD